MEAGEDSNNFMRRAHDLIDAQHQIDQLCTELHLSEENCRRGAKEGLALIERNAQLAGELDTLRASLEKVQAEKLHVEKLLKQAQHSQRILSDIGDEQEESLLEAASQTAETLRQQLTSLSNDNRKLQADYARAIEQVAQVEHDYAILFDENDALKRKHNGVRDELRDLKKGEQRMQDDNAELQSENVALQLQLVGLKQRQVEFESMKVEVKQLLDEKDVLDAELNEMQKLYEILQAQNSELVKSLENERELRQALKRELDARELEEQSRLSMEALTTQYGAPPPPPVPTSTASPPKDGSDAAENDAGNDSRLSLFEELQQQQSAADAEAAEREAKRLNIELQASREMLTKIERTFGATVDKTKLSLSQLFELAGITEPLYYADDTAEIHSRSHADSAQQVSPVFRDFQNIIDNIMKELSAAANDAGIASDVSATTTSAQKLDLQALRQFRLKCDKLTAKCAKLEADAAAGSTDFATLAEILREKQMLINGANKICDKMLTRFETNDASVDGEKNNAPAGLLLKNRLLPLLKSELAIKVFGNEAVTNDVDECDTGALVRAQDELAKKIEQLLNASAISARRDDAWEAVEPTDRAVVSPETSTAADKPEIEALYEETSKQLEEAHAENAGLKSLLATQREQIHSLRESLKSTTQTAEHSLVNLKAKYDSDKLNARENLAKLRHELNQRKEDATTFSSIRSMLTARCSDYVTQIENLQRKLKTSEQEKQTLSGLVHLAIRQKLTLIERIQELESHLDAVNLNQANDADAATPGTYNNNGSSGGWRNRKPPGGHSADSSGRSREQYNNFTGGNSSNANGRSANGSNNNGNFHGNSGQHTNRRTSGNTLYSSSTSSPQSPAPSSSSTGGRAPKRHH